ncbi:MAG: PEP/pyruvate-binding domain-containing protein [Bacteroidales bacterium]
MNKAVLIFILVLFSFRISGQNSVNSLESKVDFDNFSGLPLVGKYGQVSAIKLVYELKTQKIYYINSRHFKYHHEFCNNRLENEVDLEYFNRINYSNDSERKYLLANINYYKSLETYALEISPVDLMTQDDIFFLWNVVSKSTFIGDSLRLLLNSARLQNLSSHFENRVPVLNPSDIYRNINYQAISRYKSCGILHFINNLESEKDEINPMDIIVLNQTPLILPGVAGIIVNEFQTPLSHLAILGQNRKIPIAAYKSAFQDSALLCLNAKKVCIDVSSDTFKINLVNKIPTPKSNQTQIKLKYDLEVDSIIGVEYLDKKAFKYTGYKASNFGTLFKLSKKYNFKVPECAFVIPFYFYNQHIQNSIAKDLIDSLLNGKSNIHNNDSVKLILKNIRNAITSTPIDSTLSNSIIDKIKADGRYTVMRFRSSTNAEDAKGFSGAGLYTSKTGILNDEKQSFEKAIKKVWASLWSFEAYSEREYYNINHREVYMGILVHRSFPNEDVNGVAITKNLYRPDNYGFVVNAQLGNESVVKPEPGVISDQFICYPNNANNIYTDKNTVDIIAQSSLNDYKLVMTEAEIQSLANQLELIKEYFINHTFTSKSYLDFGLDVEFKLEGKNRELYIKQVRLYND